MIPRTVAVAALALVPVAASAAPAQAAGYCSISVPSKVSITSPYRTITGKLTSSCTSSGTEYASWDVVHPTRGFASIFIFDGTRTESIDWYDFEGTGTYTVRPSMAHDWDYNDVAQNTTRMAVRLGSRTSSSSSRRGGTVTIKATATRYSPSARGFRPWAGKTAVLRQKTCASCSWRSVGSARTNRYGQVRFTKTASARYWQVATSDSSNTWGKTSVTMKR